MLANHELIRASYGEIKFWLSVGTAFWMLFKGFNWIKEIKEKDLASIKTGISEMKTGVEGVHDQIQEQTGAIVQELHELRNDFRSYFAPAAQIVIKKNPKK